MGKIRLIGLETVKIGDLTASGIMATGASLSTIEAIVPDSAHIIFEPPGVTDLYVEDADLPDISIIGPSKRTVEFATRDIGTAILLKAFKGVAAATVWSAATSGAIVANEKCVEAISKSFGNFKLKVEIPRANVRSGGDLRFAKTESGQINFVCDVLMTASSTKIAPMKVTQVAT